MARGDTRRRRRGTAVPAAVLLAWCTLLLAAAPTGCADPEVRRESLAAIARWEDRRLAPQDSLTALLGSADAHVRLAAARAAGLIGRDDVLPPLLDLLEDRSQAVRRQACFSLGLLGDTLAVPALTVAAADPRPGVRLAVLRGLAHVSNRGEALLAAATGEHGEDAAAAWDGLRNRADEVPRDELVQAVRAGLARTDPDVLWRVLRCVERAPDSALVATVLPFAGSGDVQVRVHAYRALARLGGADARAEVLATVEDHGFSGLRASRVEIAASRALGSLAEGAPEEQMPVLAARLIEFSGAADLHVATSALRAMAAAVAGRELPAEAADRESLLPVWRIRMARAARGQLDSPAAGVRAAAAEALADLRGTGAVPELVDRLDDETTAHAAAALVGAVARRTDDPAAWALRFLGPSVFSAADSVDVDPWLRNGPVAAAALEGLAANPSFDRHALWLLLQDTITRMRVAGATDTDHVLAAVALDLLGDHPDDPTAVGAMAALGRARPAWRSDIALASLRCLEKIYTAEESAWTPAELTTRTVGEFVTAAFDDPDERVRLAARECAAATGVVPEHLVPTIASLRATLPAVVRGDAQPPLALPFDAARVRGTTAGGEFVIALDAEIAPNTCAMFLDLVERGFYDGLVFHRVVPDFVVQGGDPTGTGWGGPGYTIRSEWSERPYRRGVVGIAHSGKDTGGCQFFVTLSEQPHLMGRYTIFGEVVKGLEIFDAAQPGDAFTLSIEP